MLNNVLTPEAHDLWMSKGTFTRAARAQDLLSCHVPDGGTTATLLGGALLGVGALHRWIGARR